MYKVVYASQVEHDLCKLSTSTTRKILDRIEKYLCNDPTVLGKALKGEYQGYWRYRWGNYRVIYKLSQKELLVIILRIAHRKNVY
ncbi:MAG: type II toxin-antitoxin system RelE/ParE family toxin [Candidatus Omnitrophica bacterium]|nr:type II toxin-antitoxin system RelE/ParE family toxin [Candidatus Omnitrophota bacterium]